MRLAILATLALALPAGWARVDLGAEKVREYSRAVVRISVDGTLESGAPCKLNGTGFFIDKSGHLLTAAHVVLPCRVGDVGPRPFWQSPPEIAVETYQPDAGPGKPDVAKVRAVVVYADEQTDLAVLRAKVDESVSLLLAPSSTLKTGNSVSMLTFEVDQAQPAEKSVKVESVFNPNKTLMGLIDISGPDIKESASGSPLFNESGEVAGVFTKGRKETAQGVVPIGYGAPLFSMCGVSYPSDDVREVLGELRQDVKVVSIEYDSDSGSVKVVYEKRLEAGVSPVGLKASFDVYTKRVFRAEEYAFNLREEVNLPANQPRRRPVFFGSVGKKIDERIELMRRASAAENAGEIGDKYYALVTIVAVFFKMPKNIEIPLIHDYRLRF